MAVSLSSISSLELERQRPPTMPEEKVRKSCETDLINACGTRNYTQINDLLKIPGISYKFSTLKTVLFLGEASTNKNLPAEFKTIRIIQGGLAIFGGLLFFVGMVAVLVGFMALIVTHSPLVLIGVMVVALLSAIAVTTSLKLYTGISFVQMFKYTLMNNDQIIPMARN